MILESELWLRLGGFLGVLALMLAWETWWPRRARLVGATRHRLNNLALVVVDTALLRLVAPAAAVAAALWAESHGWGLLNVLHWPAGLELALAVVALDLAIYLQHRVFHALPLLWRLHRVHHTDLDLDTTTGLRFHPLEMLLSAGVKAVVVLALGAPAAAVVLFEVLLNACALFNHGNVALPRPLERWVRRVLVTPDVHRVHHAVPRADHDRNFGFMLICWDRLFGTYQPALGAGDERIGLATPRDRRAVDLHWLLLQPFLPRRR